MSWRVGHRQGPGLKDGNAEKGHEQGLTGSGDTAPQHSAAKFSNISDIARSPPPIAWDPGHTPAELLSGRLWPPLWAPPPKAPPRPRRPFPG